MAASLKQVMSNRHVQSVMVLVTAGVFLALTDAFGSRAALWLRLTYWIGVMMAGGLWAALCTHWLGRAKGLVGRPVLSFFVITLAIGLPLSLFVWAVSGPVFFGRVYSATLLPYVVWRVLMITGVMTAIAMMLERRRAAPERPPEPPRFLARLPLRLRGAAIRAVEAEDHYLRVHTDQGSDLILMRLSDAVKELEGLDGAQTHRSWWVARDAVVGVSRGDGRATLTLKGGLTAPVSRRHARSLREAGWY